MVADARLAEMAAAEREGLLLPVDRFREILEAIVGELRARIKAFPGKYAPRLVGLKTIGDAQAFGEQIANDFLSALRTAGGDVRDAYARRAQQPERGRRGRPRGP